VHDVGGLTGLLGLEPDLLETSGVSSPPVAQAMAEAARTAFGSDVGVGVSAVAVSADGSATVHLSVVTPNGEHARRLVVRARADALRERVAPAAAHLLREAVKSLD
jgi:nicotinamide-nucleotide amidase